MKFTKASKKSARLRLALIGPAGSGKTYSALAIATTLGPRVALIDTEHSSASKYAPSKAAPLGTPGVFEFDALDLERFEPSTYIEAIHTAEREGYDVLIIDSMSHAWSGVGGILDQLDAKSSGGGSNFNAWRTLTPQHNELVETLLRCRCHLIVTIRAKTAYEVEKDDRGKTQVKKVGLAPVQRDGLEYEFDVVLDVDAEHTARVSKTRCSELTGRAFRNPGRDVAEILARWLDGDAVPVPAAAPVAFAPPVAPVQVSPLARFYEEVGAFELPGEAVGLWIASRPALGTATPEEREAAWNALAKRTEFVGGMKNAKVWLKKAIAVEDARRGKSENDQVPSGGPGPGAPETYETAPDVSTSWLARLAGATGKQLLSDAGAVAALAGESAAAVRAAYVARWGELFKGYDDATFTAVLPKLETLPPALRQAPEWESIRGYLEGRATDINMANEAA